MNTTSRVIGWLCVAGLCSVVLAACATDGGECTLREQNAGAGVGGGVISPAGAGGYGDAPRKPGAEPQDAADQPPECDAPDETELGETFCDRPAWGATCMEVCAENGAVCYAGIKHTITNKLVLLFKCCGCKGKGECWYVDPDDSTKICSYFIETGPKWPLCK